MGPMSRSLFLENASTATKNALPICLPLMYAMPYCIATTPYHTRAKAAEAKIAEAEVAVEEQMRDNEAEAKIIEEKMDAEPDHT